MCATSSSAAAAPRSRANPGGGRTTSWNTGPRATRTRTRATSRDASTPGAHSSRSSVENSCSGSDARTVGIRRNGSSLPRREQGAAQREHRSLIGRGREVGEVVVARAPRVEPHSRGEAQLDRLAFHHRADRADGGQRPVARGAARPR
jgi:hypothetical protein